MTSQQTLNPQALASLQKDACDRVTYNPITGEITFGVLDSEIRNLPDEQRMAIFLVVSDQLFRQGRRAIHHAVWFDFSESLKDMLYPCPCCIVSGKLHAQTKPVSDVEERFQKNLDRMQLDVPLKSPEELWQGAVAADWAKRKTNTEHRKQLLTNVALAIVLVLALVVIGRTETRRDSFEPAANFENR